MSTTRIENGIRITRGIPNGVRRQFRNKYSPLHQMITERIDNDEITVSKDGRLVPAPVKTPHLT